VIGLAALASPLFGAAQNSRQFPPGTVTKLEDLPGSRLRTHLERLTEGPRQRAWEQLKSFHFTELDLGSLDVDDEGALFYADHFALDPAAIPAQEESVIPAVALPVSPFPDGLIFHSRRGSSNVLFLNFAGENVTNTQWNTSLGRTLIPAVAFSTDNNYSTFSDAEQLAIRRIWQRVSEDYAPFDIDVTTERPVTFGIRTAEALITRSTDANGAANPSSSAGGVSYVATFSFSSYLHFFPSWIYFDNLSSTESYIAEAAAHEIGHAMGLSHDGRTDGTQYYTGHGSGDISWGPIMGAAYGRNVSQWCKGEYYLANNTEDDLAIITTKIVYRPDDHGNTPQTATPLVLTGGTNIVSTTPETDPANTNTANKGTLERSTDVDVFSVTTGSGAINLVVNPWISPSGTRGGNLDLSIELHDSNGTLMATNNPATTTGAQIQMTVLAGSYYLYIRNSGTGNPLTSRPTGYTSYGSIGQYFISGKVAPTIAVPALVQLTTSANNPAWGSVTPSSGSYNAGSTVQVLATPATYYRFVSWTNGASSTNNPLTLTLATNVSVGAVFAALLTTNHPTPYWWLASYGYSNNFETAANLIGTNGIPLWQSYIAGLNPLLASSQLRLSVQRDASTAAPVLNWNTATGRLYTLWWSTNVAQTYTRLSGASNLAASVNVFTNLPASLKTRSFYRLEVSKP
jgi:hypothetical protein